MSSCSALAFCLLYNLCILYPCRLIIPLFVASPPRVAPLEPHVEEQNVGALVSFQEEHRVVDSPLGIFAAARLPLGSSLLYSLEAASRVDAAVGEGSDNYPPPAYAVDADRPSASGPSTLLLTRSGKEMAQLGRVERLAKLGSSWATFSGAYGAELKVSKFFIDF